MNPPARPRVGPERRPAPLGEGVFRGLRVLLVGPDAPPIGGMTVQAAMLRRHLLREDADVVRIASNPPVTPLLARVRGVGGVLRRRRFRRMLREGIARGADVLHVQSASWGYFWRITAFALREGRDAGLHTVLRWDGGEADAFFATDPDRIRREMLNADEVVVPSGWLARIFRERLGIEVRIVPNLVRDPGMDRPPTRPSGPLRLLCARHLESEYGVDVVIDAARHAVEHGVDLELTIAGGGTERASLEALAGGVLAGRARFLGAVPHSEVLERLRETDLVVNGSRVDNFPVALAEALAAGVPVASTDAGGIPWVVKDGVTGLLVPVGAGLALGRAIRALASDRARLVELGWSAKMEALRWTWAAVRPAWAAAYRRD